MQSTVHPHAGGENSPTGYAQSAWIGSPPRGWGKRVTSLLRMAFEPVHPHAGGENFMLAVLSLITVGSPPRGWGKRISNGFS